MPANVWPSRAAARSPAAWPRRPPTTARCCCWRARRARPSAPARRSRRRSRGCGAEVDPEHVEIVTDPHALARGDVRRRGGRRGPRRQGARCSASSNAIARPRRDPRHAPPPRCRSSALAEASGRPERFVGLHVFNPVTRMKLVELVFPRGRQRGDAQPRAGAVRDVREDARRGARHPGLRRQPPAVPLSVQRRAAARRDGHGRRPTSTPACSSAPGTRWARWRCSTSSASTSPRRSARRSASRCRARVRAADRRGRAGPQERPRLSRLLTARRRARLAAGAARDIVRIGSDWTFSCAFIQVRDTGHATSKSQRTPASSQCTRSGPLPPRAGRV